MPSFLPNRQPPLIEFMDEQSLLANHYLPHDFQTAPAVATSLANRQLRKIKGRLLIASIFCLLCFFLPLYRLGNMVASTFQPSQSETALMLPPISRGKIYDRGGHLLAGNLPTLSLYANPRDMLNPNDTAQKLHGIFPQLSVAQLQQQWQDKDQRNILLMQNLDPTMRDQLLNLGEPGLQLVESSKRFYPDHNIGSTTIGFMTDNTGKQYMGQMGLERFFDPMLKKGQDLTTSLDSNVQHYLYQELDKAKQAHKATSGGAMVMDITSGEILGLVSLPDFNPNNRSQLQLGTTFNIMTSGAYELGSVMKIITLAHWLESQQGHNGHFINDNWRTRKWDVRQPLTIKNITINDFHRLIRPVTSDEIFIYSSNIGSALLTQDTLRSNALSPQQFLQSLHLLNKMPIELNDAEVARPQLPSKWGPIEYATISFGHGLSLPPLQFAAAIGALVGDGQWHPPTLVANTNLATTTTNDQPTSDSTPWWRQITDRMFNRPTVTLPPLKHEVVSEATRQELRRLLRLNVLYGSGQRVDGSDGAVGYGVGGKTGTAEKVVDGQYSKDKNLTSFIATFPITQPRYLVFMLLDNTKRGDLAGSTLGPAVGRLISKVAPLLDLTPNRTAEQQQDAAFRAQSHFDKPR
ncbi:MAG: penicillin-binding protein 2 [Alphaproteobacteria bacterium]|nr:penicillin-binding protein 2 [Alphaproteobacteria bacterium]